MFWKKHKKEVITIPLIFICYKCGKQNEEMIKMTIDNCGYKIAVNCRHCTSLWNGSEVATINMVTAPTF